MKTNDYAFDLDGTLWTNEPGLDWEDPASILRSCRPIPEAIERFRLILMEPGRRVALITNRREAAHRDVTEQQIRAFLGRGVLENVPLIMMGGSDHDPLSRLLHKHDALRDLVRLGWRPRFVGDRDEDQTAAATVSAPFLRAWDFAEGLPFPDQGPEPTGFPEAEISHLANRDPAPEVALW